MTVWPAWLKKLSTINDATAPQLGKSNSYNVSSATGNNRVITLPPLTTGAVNAALAAGQLAIVRINKSRSDTSTKAVRVTCASGDAFESGDTYKDLTIPGEKLHLSAEQVGAAVVWVVVDHTAPPDMLDLRYVAKANSIGSLEAVGPVYNVVPSGNIEPLTRNGAFRPLKTWLKAKMQPGATGSAAINFCTDSTGTDSSPTTGPGQISLLASLLATAYPNLHIMKVMWDQGLCRMGVPTTVQVGPQGEARATFTQANSRYLQLPANGVFLDGGNLSIRVRFSATAARPARNMHLFSQWGSGGTAADEVVDFAINAPGDNRLNFRWAETNATQRSVLSTVAVNLQDGVPIDVRVDLQLTNGAGTPQYTVTFYTSTDRGATWVQLGSAVTGTTGVTSIQRPSAVAAGTVPFILGGFQQVVSGTSLFIGDIYTVDVRTGPRAFMENSYSVLPMLPQQWQCAANNTDMMTGSPTLWIVGGAWGGHALVDFISSNHNADGRWTNNDPAAADGQNNWEMLHPNYGPLVDILSTGHNEINPDGTTILQSVTWANLDIYKTKLDAKMPCAIVITTQNPRLPPVNGITRHQNQVVSISEWCQRKGGTVVDTYSMFLDHPQWTNDVTTNELMKNNQSIHPISKGHAEVSAPLLFRAIQTGA